MANQMHDIIPGTSIPKAYEYSWNDEILAANQFAGVLTSAAGAVASIMDTRTEGTAVVVYNPLNIAREDMVEARVAFPGGLPKAVRVFGPDGADVPAQIERPTERSCSRPRSLRSASPSMTFNRPTLRPPRRSR